MKLEYKMIVYPTLMVTIFIFIIVLVAKWQIDDLVANQQLHLEKLNSENQQIDQEKIKKFYFDSKDVELKNYFSLAKQSVEDLLKAGRTDAEALERAKEILSRLSYGPEDRSAREDKKDGYFFLFDVEGTFHMHPRQPDLVGRNFLRTLKEDDNDERSKQLKKIIEYANEKKNFVDYRWEKPSEGGQKPFHKRAYVELIEDLNLVLGTGVYTDDLYAELEDLNKNTELIKRENLEEFRKVHDQSVKKTVGIIVLFSIVFILFSLVFILVIAYMLKINIQGRITEANKNVELSKRIIRTQDDERIRISKALHDSINPLLLANKMKIEVAAHDLGQFMKDSRETKIENILEKLSESEAISTTAMVQVRRVIHNLKPLPLEILGLEGAIRSFINMLENSNIKFNVSGEIRRLLRSVEYAFLMVAMEAINNAIQYASAKLICVDLVFDSSHTLLKISDNGDGIKPVPLGTNLGMGIQNMKERIEGVSGEFIMNSSKRGTSIIAKVPNPINS